MTKLARVPYQAPAFIASGLTGSVAASRYVGATTTGAPATGAHLVGDWIVTQDGHIFVCTAAGTPGTWTNAGASVTMATSVTSETTYGIAAAVGTSTNAARQDHTHGTPATPVTSAVAGTGIGVSGATGAVTISNTGATSVAGRTGPVTLTAADIAAGTFPGANSYSGLQTFNAGITVPAGAISSTGNITENGNRVYSAGNRPPFHGCRLTLSADISINNAAVPFDTETFDTDGYHNTVTNPSRLTIPSGLGGKYRISGYVDFYANATGIRYCFLKKNGTTTVAVGVIVSAAGTSAELASSVDSILDLAAGDYIELIAWQTTGGALSVFSGTAETRLEANFIGP